MSDYTNLLIAEPPLQVLPSLAVKVGLNAGIVLQQIHYWLGIVQKGAKNKESDYHFFEGRWWTYNTYEDWRKDNFPFWSHKTIKRIFAGMKQRGLIDCRPHEKRNDGLWVTINYPALNSVIGSGQVDPTPDDDGSGQDDPTSEQGSGQSDPTGGQNDPDLRDSENTLETSSDTFDAPAAHSSLPPAINTNRAAFMDYLQSNPTGAITKKVESTEPLDISSHGLVAYLSQANNLSVQSVLSSKSVFNALTKTRFWENDLGRTEIPSAVDLWDKTPGFQAFVKEQAPILIASQRTNRRVNVEQIISFLADFHTKPGGRLLKFPAWRDKNPSLCKDINTFAPIEEIGPGIVEDAIQF